LDRRRFVIIGLGSFGKPVTMSLHQMGHEVLALDKSKKAVQAARSYCSRAAVIDVSDRTALEKIGVQDADVGIVGLGSKIAASILVTMFLKEFGIKEIIAKAVSIDHGHILERAGATEVIHPERDIAKRLAVQLTEPEVIARIPFLEGFALLEVQAPKTIWGKNLGESRLRSKYHLTAALIRRKDENGEKSLPATANQVVKKGDVLLMLGKREDLEMFRQDTGESL